MAKQNNPKPTSKPTPKPANNPKSSPKHPHERQRGDKGIGSPDHGGGRPPKNKY